MASKKNPVYRDYNQYKSELQTNKKIISSKPLMFTIVFICALLALISMFFPVFKAYVWSDQMGWPASKGLTFSANTYNIIRMVIENKSTFSPTPGGSLEEAIDSNPMVDMILNGSDKYMDAITLIIVVTILGAILLLLTLAQFILSMCGIVGANKLILAVRIISVIAVVINIAWVICAAQIYISSGLFYESVSMTVKFSYGALIVSFFILAGCVSSFAINK